MIRVTAPSAANRGKGVGGGGGSSFMNSSISAGLKLDMSWR